MQASMRSIRSTSHLAIIPLSENAKQAMPVDIYRSAASLAPGERNRSAAMAEPTLMVCSSKVATLKIKTKGNTDVAEHILGFAVADYVEPEASCSGMPESCRKCRAACIVDRSDKRVWRQFLRGCPREERLERERLCMILEDTRSPRLY